MAPAVDEIPTSSYFMQTLHLYSSVPARLRNAHPIQAGSRDARLPETKHLYLRVNLPRVSSAGDLDNTALKRDGRFDLNYLSIMIAAPCYRSNSVSIQLLGIVTLRAIIDEFLFQDSLQ